MRWPRGRYNGLRIEGVRLTLRINVFWWSWLPDIYVRYLPWRFGWLCFHVHAEPEYGVR